MVDRAKDAQKLLNKIGLLQMGQSQNLVQILGATHMKNVFLISMDKMEGGCLKPLLKVSMGQYSKAFCKFRAFSVLTALLSLQKQNIIHNQVRPEHVLINRNGEIKLTSFSSTFFKNKTQEK